MSTAAEVSSDESMIRETDGRCSNIGQPTISVQFALTAIGDEKSQAIVQDGVAETRQ